MDHKVYFNLLLSDIEISLAEDKLFSKPVLLNLLKISKFLLISISLFSLFQQINLMIYKYLINVKLVQIHLYLL